jgi:phosphate transport system permease protein
MEGSATDQQHSTIAQQAELEVGVPGGAVPPDAGNKPPTKAVEGSSTWSLLDRLGLAFCWFLGLLFCAIAVAIVVYLLIQGIQYLKVSQLTTPAAAGFTDGESGGFSDAFIGTMILGVMGISMALPIGVAIAVWLVEYGRPKALARITELTIEAIAGIPSIVLALFGTVIFTSTALGFLSRSNEGVVFGRSFFAASSMLALEALPLIVASTREGLNSIPRHVREASYAVGKTKAATTRRILLPTARPQIATGGMLGLGRIIGDTAIILVLLGATQNFSEVEGAPFPLNYLRGAGTSLTSFVYEASPTGNLNQPQKAYAAAFVLLLMVLLLNAGTDIVHRRAKKGGTWSH